MSHYTASVSIEWWGLPLVATLSVREGEPATLLHPGADRSAFITELRLETEHCSFDLTTMLDSVSAPHRSRLEAACLERI